MNFTATLPAGNKSLTAYVVESQMYFSVKDLMQIIGNKPTDIQTVLVNASGRDGWLVVVPCVSAGGVRAWANNNALLDTIEGCLPTIAELSEQLHRLAKSGVQVGLRSETINLFPAFVLFGGHSTSGEPQSSLDGSKDSAL